MASSSGKTAAFLAVAAADIGTNDAYGIEGAIHQAGQVLAYLVRVLGGVPDGEQVGFGVVFGKESPALHGRRGQALNAELLADDAVGAGKSGVEVATLVDGAEYLVGPEVLVYDGSARRRSRSAGR